MIITDASYEILRLDKERDIAIIARGYSICYNTETPKTFEEQCAFIRKHRNHGSPQEHSIMSVEFNINRGISHELVRHRHTAYSQESTRYCNYRNKRFDSQITFIRDSHVENSAAYDIWVKGLQADEDEYFARLAFGQTPEEARGCLPNDLRTRLLVSTNFREWHDIFTLRCDTHAHYQMREVMRPLLDNMIRELPCLFDDISY